MSATCLRVLSCLAFALAVGLVGSGSTRADDLERIQVASQKALADARAQLTAARKVQASDPDKAKEHLNVAWFHLEDAKAASPAEVRALQNEIQRLLTQVEATLRERSRAAAEAANREAVKKSEQDRRRDLEKPRYGSGGTTKPEDFIKQGRDVLGKYADLKKIREMNVTAIERETMIATADIVEKRFNAARSKWLQENRPEQKLTKEEKHLLKMLNSVMSVDFNKTSLKEAIELIQSKTDLAIFVDDLSLKELELDYDNSQVTFKANKVTVRSILKKVLA